MQESPPFFPLCHSRFFFNLFIIIFFFSIFFFFFRGVASQFRAMIFFTFLTFGIIFYSYIFVEEIEAK